MHTTKNHQRMKSGAMPTMNTFNYEAIKDYMVGEYDQYIRSHKSDH